MRAADMRQPVMFSHVALEHWAPKDRPIRKLRMSVDLIRASWMSCSRRAMPQTNATALADEQNHQESWMGARWRELPGMRWLFHRALRS